MKSFFTDSDGFSTQDMEKLTLNLLFSLSVLTVLYKFLTKDLSDVVIVQFSISIGGLMVARKFGSYYTKSKQTASNISDNTEQTETNQK